MRLQKRAQKQHLCSMCGRPILRNTEYIHVSEKEDRLYRVQKLHIHCDALIFEAMKNGAPANSQDYDKTRSWCRAFCSPEWECAQSCAAEECTDCPVLLGNVLKGPMLQAAMKSALEICDD